MYSPGSARGTLSIRAAGPLLILFALAAFGCAGERPTLTSERLVETAAEAQPAATAAPVVEEAPAATPAPTAVPTEVPEPVPAEPASPAALERFSIQVLDTAPHDTQAFTQGLELHDGLFIESTGRKSFEETGIQLVSDMRRVDPLTGEVVQIVTTPSDYFAEGVTKVDDQLIQLTWQAGKAFYWDATTFEPLKEVDYEGEGWGLCYDGFRLVMTDGLPELIFRDPESFDEIGRVTVTLNGQELENLNEIECVNGDVWANIWKSNAIVRINPTTGEVTGLADAGLLDRPPEADFLNGIAWDDTTQSFYVTGKLWPTMYRITFALTSG